MTKMALRGIAIIVHGTLSNCRPLVTAASDLGSALQPVWPIWQPGVPQTRQEQ
jgi:hypothetical protein